MDESQQNQEQEAEDTGLRRPLDVHHGDHPSPAVVGAEPRQQIAREAIFRLIQLRIAQPAMAVAHRGCLRRRPRVARGQMVAAGGLLPSSQGVRIRVSGGKTSVIDGPFAETKELVGGFAIFDLDSKQAAIESGRQFMQGHADILGPSYEGELEIRPMFDTAPNSANQS